MSSLFCPQAAKGAAALQCASLVWQRRSSKGRVPTCLPPIPVQHHAFDSCVRVVLHRYGVLQWKDIAEIEDVGYAYASEQMKRLKVHDS